MDKLPYEDAAMRGAPLPEGLDLTDAAVYIALRGLYAFHQLGMMDRKEAAAEKQRLKKLRDDTRRQQRFERDLARTRWDLIKATEAARSTFRMEPTVEHGFALCAAIDGAKQRREATAHEQKEFAPLVGAGDDTDGVQPGQAGSHGRRKPGEGHRQAGPEPNADAQRGRTDGAAP